MIEVGGAEQLQLENKNGSRPVHSAARHNPNVDVLRYLVERWAERISCSWR
eukprot:COSAG06_NODE_48913_length_327_cov_0.491304_1_plen_50_part_10